MTAPSCHCELVKVKQAPSEARLRQHSPSKGKCAWGCTISLLLAFQLNPESPWTVTNGKDHLVVFPVALLRPCCAHTWQSKRPLSVQIVLSRICNNLLSSLFIWDVSHAKLSEESVWLRGRILSCTTTWPSNGFYLVRARSPSKRQADMM